MQCPPKLPDELGHLVLNEEGAVLSSSGELMNNERLASIIMKILTSTSRSQLWPADSGEDFRKMTITYSDHCYIVRLSNKRIDIIKKKHWLNNEPVKV